MPERTGPSPRPEGGLVTSTYTSSGVASALGGVCVFAFQGLGLTEAGHRLCESQSSHMDTGPPDVSVLRPPLTAPPPGAEGPASWSWTSGAPGPDGPGGGLDTAVGECYGEAGLLASATWGPALEETEGFFFGGGNV